MKLKIYNTIILFTLFLSVDEKVDAQVPNWLWAKKVSGNVGATPYEIAVDANGNSFITGVTQSDSLTFDNLTITNYITIYSTTDFFLAKYDASGNIQWAKNAQGPDGASGEGVAVDANGNSIVTGAMGDTLTLDSTILISNNYSNLFIAKYDPSGNLLWAKNEGGLIDVFPYGVEADLNGNIYIIGQFRGSVFTIGNTTLINNSNPGEADIFVAKYDSSGNSIWATSFGGINSDRGNSIKVDANGNVYVTGSLGSLNVTIGNTTLNGGLFVVKYDSMGNVIWANGEGAIASGGGNSISLDANGNSYITGAYFGDSLTLGSTTLISTDAGITSEVYIAKLDASGNFQWAKNGHGYGTYEESLSIAVDSAGYSYIIGPFSSDTLSFDNVNLYSIVPGEYDWYIFKFSPSGNALWGISVAGIQQDAGTAVALNSNGNLYATGIYISSSLTFGNTTLINSSGSDEIAIAKLDYLTSVKHIESINGISIYPNPANGLLVISYPTLSGKEISVSITDITGKIIYKTTATNTQKLEVNTKNFAEGVYFVHVQTNDFVETRKVVVTR